MGYQYIAHTGLEFVIFLLSLPGDVCHHVQAWLNGTLVISYLNFSSYCDFFKNSKDIIRILR